MLQWYENIRKLIKVSGEERNAFVAGATQSRTEAAASIKDELETVSENDFENDEADDIPYSAGASVLEGSALEPPPPVRPEGGRFPSDINIHRSVVDTEVVSPGVQRPRSDSHSSTWSYDEKVSNCLMLYSLFSLFCRLTHRYDRIPPILPWTMMTTSYPWGHISLLP